MEGSFCPRLKLTTSFSTLQRDTEQTGAGPEQTGAGPEQNLSRLERSVSKSEFDLIRPEQKRRDITCRRGQKNYGIRVLKQCINLRNYVSLRAPAAWSA